MPGGHVERFLDILIPDARGFALMSLVLVGVGLVIVAGVLVCDRRSGGHASGVLLAHPLTASLSLVGVTSSVAFATDVALSWLCSIGFLSYAVACVADRVAAGPGAGGPARESVSKIDVRASVRSLCEVVSWVCVLDLAVLFMMCVADTVVPRYMELAGMVS